MKFCLDEDYPEIKVDKKDKNLAIYLLNSYTGIVSEDTAIHNYVFQMISQINPEITTKKSKFSSQKNLI